MSQRVAIQRLPTGVPGLDEILGGGLPEFSFNVIAGGPGAGKTTLAQQIMFSLANRERPAIYFTVVGEPTLKLLRYQQQFDFFDAAKVGESVKLVNLGEDLLDATLEQLLARIVAEVEKSNPSVVVVDSFRSVIEATRGAAGERDMQVFVQQLAIRLTCWQATTFLIGEFLATEIEHNPIFTVADGLFWLHQSVDRNSMVRKLQVVKSRGQASIPGLHTFRITGAGVQTFPRMILGSKRPARERDSSVDHPTPRLSSGIPTLDTMLGGGIPEGYAALVAGPSGAGKTILASEFLCAGAERDEPGVVAVFEKRPGEYAHSGPMAERMEKLVRAGRIAIVQSRPLDLSIDEMLGELIETIQRTGAKRLVVDSLNGFEMALAPTFREDFRESLYRMVAVLTGMGVTMMMTAELEDHYTELRFSPHGSAFLADCIILARYVELEGELKRVLTVAKVRASAHQKELRLFTIDSDRLMIGEPLRNYMGLLSGRPEKLAPQARPEKPE